MKVSDLYKAKLAEAQRLSERADAAKGDQRKEDLRHDAYDAEVESGFLAHCIALFGDFDVALLDLKAARRAVAGMDHQGRNLWAFGLDLVQRCRLKE